ncbi:hypothetical protein SUGI_0970760 [Cryptomeria japonica]|nr:hypothetical protein SUGI_0970760 [Cryptomeria japonica]
MEDFIRGGGKVRKRGSSSSSSSTILQNVKLKRAILAGRRGGSSTPVPNWKMSSETPPMASSPYPPSLSGIARGNRVSVSARKLAATLWELQEIPTSSTAAVGIQQDKKVKKSSRNGDYYKTRSRERTPLQSHFLPPHLSDPSHSPSSLTADRSGTGSLRRQIASLIQRNGHARKNGGSLQPLRSPSNVSSMEIETRDRPFTPSSSLLGLKVKSGESGYNLTTSSELLKILNRIWSLEEQHSSSVSLVSALRSELEHARGRIRELMQEQREDRHQIDSLMKRVAEEKMIWKTKEQDKVRAAIQTAREELEDERKFRRKLESVNKKLTRELDETKGALAKALQDFEREQKARELMEEVCDELAREIGEDKAEVEELKRESAKVWEEVEEERKMLQMAEVWREERVQMKLAEARLELEEKNEILDKLRSELEAFLRAKRANDLKSEVRNRIDAREAELQRDSMNEVKSAPQGIDDEDSADSDLHSIELNRETLEDNTRAYKWSYATSGRSEETKGRRSDQRANLNEESKGRRSNDQRIQIEDQMGNTWHGSKAQILDRLKGNNSLDKERMAEGIEWDFTSSSQWIERNIESWDDGQDHGKPSKNATESLARADSLTESECNGAKQDQDKARRFKSVGGGRDHFVSSALVSAHGSASPTRQWNHHWPPPDPGSARIGRSKGGPDWAKGSRENTLKARLLEARLEGQHTRAGRSKFLEYK